MAEYAGKKAALTGKVARLAAVFLLPVAAHATQAAGLDPGIPNFSNDAMLLNLIKYAPEPLKEVVWLSAAEQEIKLAQTADRYDGAPGQQIGDWVFPPASLRDRNPAVAAQELLPQFKAEVLRRAKQVQDTFVLRGRLGNLRYDRASGVILFGNGKLTDAPIPFKHPMNAKFNGVPLYALNRGNDGLMQYADGKQYAVVGLRHATSMGPPALLTDRQLSIHPIKMPRDQAEKLLNGAQLLNINVVMTITGADRQLSQGNYATVSTHGILFARVDKVYVTDPNGQVLATYDGEALPDWPSPKAARAVHPRR
jgi:hypothetical protein